MWQGERAAMRRSGEARLWSCLLDLVVVVAILCFVVAHTRNHLGVYIYTCMFLWHGPKKVYA